MTRKYVYIKLKSVFVCDATSPSPTLPLNTTTQHSLIHNIGKKLRIASVLFHEKNATVKPLYLLHSFYNLANHFCNHFSS